MRFHILYSCMSHIGKLRSMNQDNFYCDGHFLSEGADGLTQPVSGQKTVKETPLFAVFDGMGGESCGEVASRIASQVASRFTLQADGVQDLEDFCTEANAEICQYAADNGIDSMGTTAAMLLFTKRAVVLCNIGDSRIFRIFRGKIEQISTDHVSISVFGKKPPLSQNLGIPPEEMLIEPYLSNSNLRKGDRYLICSDGLTDMVTVEEINEIVQAHPVQEAAQMLLEKALEHGGRDNITLILLEVQQKPFWKKEDRL